MGNPRQRSKARSSAHKTVKHSRHAKRNLRKMKPIRGPKALQDAWDNKKTLRQNYAAMGLIGSLKQADSGGSDLPLPMALVRSSEEAGLATQSPMHVSKGDAMPQRFGRILRDAAGTVTGVEIIGEDTQPEHHDKGDDMAVTGREDESSRTSVVKVLESLAQSSKPVPRFSSGGEVASLRNLVAKHGSDFEAMAKDRGLNSWQRTAGQLARASKKAGLI